MHFDRGPGQTPPVQGTPERTGDRIHRFGVVLECWSRCVARTPGEARGPCEGSVASASAAATTAGIPAAFAGLITIPAKDGTIAARLKGHRGGLSAARTDDRCAL